MKSFISSPNHDKDSWEIQNNNIEYKGAQRCPNQEWHKGDICKASDKGAPRTNITYKTCGKNGNVSVFFIPSF